jgi:hypothetical protein
MVQCLAEAPLGVARVAKVPLGIRFNEHLAGNGAMIFAHACRLGLEGIVSKHSLAAGQWVVKRLGYPWRILDNSLTCIEVLTLLGRTT